jgi:uncharacterized membrane protein
MPEDDSVSVNTGLFGLRLTGPNSLIMFLFIVVIAVGALEIWSHRERAHEHQEIVCMIKLNLYMNSIPRGELLDWSKLPIDLFSCIPRFYYETNRQVR